MTSGTDFLGLEAGDAPTGGLTTWLTDRLRRAITAGDLTPGTALPATRTLARDLGISRGAVVEAYQRLADEGLVEARTGAGTVVLPSTPAARPATAPTGPGKLRLPLTGPSRPEGVVHDLSPGVPDLSAFPRAAWLRAERAVLDTATAADLGYGDPRGTPVLRRELTGWLARMRGVQTLPDDVLVVSGVAQALAILAQVLQRHGITRVGVEDPGSRGAVDQMRAWGMRPVPVPVDADGLDVDRLAATDAQAALVTPAHQFPTGVVLAPERRRALLSWAHAVEGLVIEDDYDAEHRYDRAPVPALQRSAPELVAHAGSTSKSLAPGMRLGWLIAPSWLREDLVAAKHDSDLGSPALPQLVLARLIASGGYERHLRAVRTRQRQRRDAAVAALREFLPDARVEGVAAGLHLLVTLPGPLDDVALSERALAAGVLVHPLSWHRSTPGPPGLLIGYAALPPDRLHEAIRLLAAVRS